MEYQAMDPYEPSKLPIYDIDWAAHITRIGKPGQPARYDGILQGIVNPKLLLSPLMTREAVLSSKIEGTQVSLEDVLQYEADIKEPFTPDRVMDIHEVQNYRKAMGYAVNELKNKPLTINMIMDIHRILLTDVRGKDRTPGEIRRIQNYIGLPGDPIEKAVFVPPSPPVVMDALSNWEEYLHMEEKDPLVQLAILKAQFELIHPFSDGNGRIGRILVPLMLYYKKHYQAPCFTLAHTWSAIDRYTMIGYWGFRRMTTGMDGYHSFYKQLLNRQRRTARRQYRFSNCIRK